MMAAVRASPMRPWSPRLRRVCALLALLPLTACSREPAQPSTAERTYRAEPVANPGRDAALLDFGHHVRLRLAGEGTRTRIELPLRPDLLRAADLSTLRLARYDPDTGRYAVVSDVDWPDGLRGFATIDRSGDYSIVALPADPSSRAALGSLCAVGLDPSPTQVEPICTRILCTAFREGGDTGAFDGTGLPGWPGGGGAPGGGDVCERCMKAGTRGGALVECTLRPEPGPAVTPGKRPFAVVPACSTTPPVMADPSLPGPYAVGSTNYHFPDAVRVWNTSDVDVWATVRYPATTAGADMPAASGAFPLVVYQHGNHGIYDSGTEHLCSPVTPTPVPNHEGYNYVLERLASHGFIAVSMNTNDLNCGQNRIYERAHLILEHLRRWREWNDPAAADPTFNGRFHARVDMKRIGLAGHSRGGEAVILAEIENRRLGHNYDIKAIHGIAPTDAYGNLRAVNIPYFMILGAADGDVGHSSLLVYDRTATRANPSTMAKMQSYVYGANHNWFNTVWFDDDGAGSPRISHAAQRAVERVYGTAFFRWHLQGYAAAARLFDGAARVPTSVVDAFVYRSFQDPAHRGVDDFEDAPPNAAANTLLGTNTGASLMPFAEYNFDYFAHPFNNSFRHETKGLIAGWNAPTGAFTLDVPPAHRDVSGYQYVSFRVAQVVGTGSTNPVGGIQDLDLGLEDASGRRVFYRVGSHAPIPYGYQRQSPKTVLQTIRVALGCFANRLDNVDRTAVARIHFRFNRTAVGMVALDDIQFSR